MDVYVINLDSQTDRLETMRRRVPGLKRIAAVNGWALAPDVLSRGRHFPCGYDLSPPEIGCLMSHRAAWTALIESGKPCGCVLEDDVLIAPDFTHLMAEDDWLPAAYDIVKIETTQKGILLDRLPAGRVENRKLHRLRSRHLAAGGYIVSRAGAEKLLALSETFPYPVDVLMFDHRVPEFWQLHIYQMTPALCVQAPYIGIHQSDSTIRDHRGRKPKHTLRHRLAKRLHDMKSWAMRPLNRSLSVPFA